MGMMQALDTLEYFEDKARHLQSLTVANQAMMRYGAVVEWKKGQGWDGVFVGPEGEPVEAFVLTLRLFNLGNEPISLRKMRKLYAEIPLSPGLIGRFNEQCDELNKFLDEETSLSIEEGKRLTYRDIFSIFLNGSLAHGNDPAKRRTFRDIREGAFFPLFQTYFAQVIRGFTLAIQFLREVNQEAIEELRSTMKTGEVNSV